jgi:hypothetical protein
MQKFTTFWSVETRDHRPVYVALVGSIRCLSADDVPGHTSESTVLFFLHHNECYRGVGVNYLKLRCMMSWMTEPGGDVGMGQGCKVSWGGSQNMGK